MANKMTAARAIVEVMKREGVSKAFCVPGESYLSVMDAMYDSDIELISGRQEGGVSFMAEAYAKATGDVGVCLATRGPGATNLSIGLHTAYQDSTPVVAFIGQVESYFRGKEGFQEIDLDDYFSHIVKWTTELREADRVPELLHRAFHIARSGRPGPVVVSLPEDILDIVAEMTFQEKSTSYKPRPADESIEKMTKVLESAKRPLIIAGGGVTHSRTGGKVIALAEQMNIPVATAFRRFDAFPNDHDHYIGSLGLTSPDYLTEAVKKADVILAIGTRFSQVTTQNYSLIDPSTKLIHVDISEEELNKVYRPYIGVVADASQFLDDLLAELMIVDYKHSVEEGYIENLRKKYVEFSTPKRSYSDEYVDMEGVLFDLNEQLPDDTIITTDAGNFFGWIYRYYTFTHQDTYIGPTSGAMGYGLPSAIGAKLAHPNRHVVAFAGDGGTMMTVQELETCVRYNIPLIFIIVNNNMYGTIRMHQEKNFPERVIATELSNPDFAQLMTNIGGFGVAVRKNDEFKNALKEAMEIGKPSVIELHTNQEKITVTSTIDDLRKS